MTHIEKLVHGWVERDGIAKTRKRIEAGLKRDGQAAITRRGLEASLRVLEEIESRA